METLSGIPVKGFVETSFVDWPGKICSIIVFPRCNFRCRYCHNAELVLRYDSLEDIDFREITKRLSALKGWVDGVCISGGEPTLHPSLTNVLAFIKNEGFLTKLDTNGSNPEILKALIEEGLIDYVAMDVKSCLDETSYCNITQTPNILATVKKSIRLLIEGNVKYEFRVTVVPSFHCTEDIYKLAMELNGAARLRVQNFHPSEAIIDPGLKQLKPYTDEDIAFFQQRVDQLIAS